MYPGRTLVLLDRIRVEKCRNRNVDVDDNAKGAFEIVRFRISQEIANNKDAEDQYDDIEEVEV